ncbi:hypothetical protein DHB64_18065 [Antarcticibacterium sp. W02-3]|nr:hypothetical protein [Antarcticibacterium sp. W02-3]
MVVFFPAAKAEGKNVSRSLWSSEFYSNLKSFLVTTFPDSSLSFPIENNLPHEGSRYKFFLPAGPKNSLELTIRCFKVSSLLLIPPRHFECFFLQRKRKEKMYREVYGVTGVLPGI